MNYNKALEAIENEDQVCYDVALEYGQIFSNVKHMKWFVEAVGEELTAKCYEEEK